MNFNLIFLLALYDHNLPVLESLHLDPLQEIDSQLFHLHFLLCSYDDRLNLANDCCHLLGDPLRFLHQNHLHMYQ